MFFRPGWAGPADCGNGITPGSPLEHDSHQVDHYSFRIGVLTTEAQDGAVSNEADNLAMSSTVATWPPRDVRVGGFGPLVAVLRGGRLLVA